MREIGTTAYTILLESSEKKERIVWFQLKVKCEEGKTCWKKMIWYNMFKGKFRKYHQTVYCFLWWRQWWSTKEVIWMKRVFSYNNYKFKVLSRTNFMNKFYKQIEKIDNEAILLFHGHWILKTY